MEPGFILLIILVAGAVIAFAIYSSARRRKELAAWAEARGLSFSREKIRDMDDRYPEFKCLRRGRSRYAFNIMRGDLQGMPVTAFDYRYVTGSGKNRRVHHFSALIARSPLPLKPLFIRREHAFDRVTEFLGWDDIDFESAEFSRKFYVTSPDKRWAFDVIHQRMMEYLLAAPRYSLQFDSGNVIAWKSSRFKGPGFDEAFGLIKGMLDRLPEYLFRK
jgi:hypothetical protein